MPFRRALIALDAQPGLGRADRVSPPKSLMNVGGKEEPMKQLSDSSQDDASVQI